MFNIKRYSEYFFSKSIYCFTSDLDWASEQEIQDTVNIFKELELPLTVFTTHNSKTINETYINCRQHVGLHPDIKPDNDIIERLDYYQSLWPEAICFRSHSFYDSSRFSLEMKRRKFKYDSNLCLFLQPYCTPLIHCSGLLRFPVFWEDDIHAMKGIAFQLGKIIDILQLPGLKIFNFHPANLFSSTKAIPGNIDFLRELAKHINNNCKVMYLDDLYLSLIREQYNV